MTDDFGTSGLWTFMVQVYAMPGVAKACLALQQAHGLDVSLFLAVLHGAASGRALDREALCKLDRDCADWRETVIQPLRGVRRIMKGDQRLPRNNAVAALREQTKAMELLAERIEVEELNAMITALPIAPPIRNAMELGEVAAQVLDVFDTSRSERIPQGAALVAGECAAYFLKLKTGEFPGLTVQEN